MKYIIRRSSSWDEKPIDLAIKESVHYFDRRTRVVEKTENWKQFTKCNHDIHLDEDDCWCGTNNNPSDVWVADVEDLHKFCKEYGTIILMKPDNAEGLWIIEIYDSYRE